LSRTEVEGVGYEFGDLAEYSECYDIDALADGFQTVAGEEIFFVRNPALGLWAHRSRMAAR